MAYKGYGIFDDNATKRKNHRFRNLSEVLQSASDYKSEQEPGEVAQKLINCSLKAMEDGNGGDGYLLINEVRDYYGLPSIPNGDVLYTKTTAKGGGNSGNGNSEFSGNPVNGQSND